MNSHTVYKYIFDYDREREIMTYIDREIMSISIIVLLLYSNSII